MRPLPVIASCVLAIGTSVAGGDAISGFLPDPASSERAVLDGRTWLAAMPLYEMRVTMLDDAERQQYVERLTGVPVDPFGSPPGAAPAYLTWHIEITNLGRSTIPFRPQSAWVVLHHGRVEPPIGMETLHVRYRSTGRELPAAYERVGSAFLEADSSIEPGETLSGLLVFKNVGPRTRKLTLEVPLTLPTGDWDRVRLPYRRDKPAKRGDE